MIKKNIKNKNIKHDKHDKHDKNDEQKEKPRDTKIDENIEPIKIIYKYKNMNRKNQYITYIFVGNAGKPLEELFKKIENLDLYNTLLTITVQDEKKLTNLFGEKWVTKLFNIYHISGFINSFTTSPNIKFELLKKYDDKWLSSFINNFKTDIIFKKVNYSYSELIKFQHKVKMGTKLKKMEIDIEDVEAMDFKDSDAKSRNILYSIDETQMGGGTKDETEKETETETEKDETEEEEEEDDIEMNTLKKENEEDIDYDILTVESDMNLDEEDINKIYQKDDIDTNLSQTIEMLSNALDDKKILKKKEKNMILFDVSNYDSTDHQLMETVYVKKFVYSQYLNKDDTIQTIKNKISCSILNNNIFGKQNYIIPSRMYLWSEYLIKDKIEKITIGNRWLKKNELLDIDIEPLSLKNYENLEGNIKNLRDGYKRYGGKIKKEDEHNFILYDYDQYVLNDEIYMIDIYNEFGQEYSIDSEKLKNLTDTYIKYYYPKIKNEDIKHIIQYVNNDPNTDENLKIKNTIDTIYNELIIENEICNFVQETSMKEYDNYENIFTSENYIIQSNIHVNLVVVDNEEIENANANDGSANLSIPKLDLFRVFYDFVPSDIYPFIQYQLFDGQIPTIKYHENYMYEATKTKSDIDMIRNWFENSPYGISFKMRVKENKFIVINLNEVGKIEYKSNWKEEEYATILDVIKTYIDIKNLVISINALLQTHPKKMYIKIPEDYEFRFAFINSIQSFKLPESTIISHNDFSHLCSLFYPYVAIVSEYNNKDETSLSTEKKIKYGTYLRYKRVSKFDNKHKIEQRILSYLKNYNFSEGVLIHEISRQFNLSIEKTIKQIEKVRTSFPIQISSKKFVKKSNVLPKYKPSGIEIAIQGKIPEKYKIRISGARERRQLDRIIRFMNVMLYIYIDIYINKNPERIKIVDRLNNLANIAKSLNKIDEIINYQKETSELKEMTKQDKKRLAFKPDDGKHQWTRLCQNSGKDNKRRPLLTTNKNASLLIKKGYKLNTKTNEYEKKTTIKKNGKSIEIVLKAMKLSSTDDNGNVSDVVYSCNKEDNGDHMFIGFLTRSNNPFGECMPCCFKKNRYELNKPEYVNFHNKCMGVDIVKDSKTKQKKHREDIEVEIDLNEDNDKDNDDDNRKNKHKNREKDIEDIIVKKNIITGDILYILQDTLKIHEDRLSVLPTFLEYFMNIHFKKKRYISNHYLLQTNGYYFRYGINIDDYSFLNTLESVLSLSKSDIKKKIVNFLKKDVFESYYYSLNDGDIRSTFRIGDFINFIETSEFIDYIYLKDLLKIPGLFTTNGIYTVIFNRSVSVNNDVMNEDFYLETDISNVIDDTHNINLLNKLDVLMLISDGKYYYPIIELVKLDENTKNIKLIKMFNKVDSSELIKELEKFYRHTINDISIDHIQTHKSAKNTIDILFEITNFDEKHEYYPCNQVIDTKYKCKFIICKNNVVIPVVTSGIYPDIPILCFREKIDENNIDDCFSRFKFLSMDDTIKHLEKLYKMTKGVLNIKPIGLFFDAIDEDDVNVNVIGVMTSNNDLVPIKSVKIKKEELDKNKTLYINRPFYYVLDKKLVSYDKNKMTVIDERIKNVNLQKYRDESYQLFRYELSNLLTSSSFKDLKQQLKELVVKNDVYLIQDFILGLCVNKLHGKTLSNSVVGPQLINVIDDIPNLQNYVVNNKRTLCQNNGCDTNPTHCVLHGKKCSLSLTEEYLLEFIKKISYEFLEQEIKTMEIFKEKNRYVEDIVDRNNFSEIDGQKIIKFTNTGLNNILNKIFGDEDKPIIGKRHIKKLTENETLLELREKNQIKDIKLAYQQNIVPHNYSILRAYVNGYYWIKHNLYSVQTRNLGFYSETQNNFINIFRSLLIDWLNIPSNIQMLIDVPTNIKNILANNILYIKSINDKHKINEYIIQLMENPIENNIGLFEMFILNIIHKIPICIVINGIYKYKIDTTQKNNIVEITESNETSDKDYKKSSNICINLMIFKGSQYPSTVEIVYYK